MRRRWTRSARRPSWLVPAIVFALSFGGATYVLTPEAPGKPALRAEWNKRTTDQRYSDCRDARENGHEDILAWEPSYRPEMDGDGDGRACEPRRA